GPDVNTNEHDMKHFVEAIGNWRGATGKPANYCMDAFGKKGEKCGIPHEFGSTGFGVAHAAKVALALAGIDINKATVAIEGFGNVGSFAFSYLKAMGARIVAVADRKGTIYDTEGLRGTLLAKIRASGKEVSQYPKGKKLSHEAIFGLPVDVLIPAAVTDVINEKNMHTVKAKIIVEGANIPMSEKIERELSRKGILIVPDFVANAGGVISSYAEYRGYNPKHMFELVEKKITATARAVLKKSISEKKFPSDVAMEIAVNKVKARMRSKTHTFSA
ncbi:MAG: NAD-glutamate dehydrogenase domain-containing protein, partial [Patescibacteria group bacterium]